MVLDQSSTELAGALARALHELNTIIGEPYKVRLTGEDLSTLDLNRIVFGDRVAGNEVVYYDESPSDDEIAAHVRGRLYSENVARLIERLVERNG